MYHHVGVVGHDPLAERIAVHGHGRDVVVILQAFLDLAGDGLEMGLGGAGANDEEVRERGDVAEIDGDEIDGLFVCGVFRAEAGELFSFDEETPGKGGVVR